jgi:hypothetical protein
MMLASSVAVAHTGRVSRSNPLELVRLDLRAWVPPWSIVGVTTERAE